MAGHVTLFLCGDVMTGRGIDQILPHPGDARLYEPFVPSATVYVALADKAHGRIPRPVDFSYVWGDALAELDRRRPVAGGGRVLVFAFGSATSGIPASWAATEQRPGINLLPDLSDRTIRDVARQIAAPRRADDIVVISIHWGTNWGYEIDDEYRAFAHGLIDRAGVDVVHGHSSHHAKAIEVYRDRLILYGCGDFLNDYEGITGHETFRDDLALMYFPTIDIARGTPSRLDMVPLRIRHMRLARASRTDADWLRAGLDREGARFNTGVRLGADNVLTLDWLDGPPHERP